jgi:hypothetical protein
MEKVDKWLTIERHTAAEDHPVLSARGALEEEGERDE